MATIDATRNTHPVALEPELQGATAPQVENQATLQRSSAKPGAALAALGASPTVLAPAADGIDQAARIEGVVQSITSNPEQLLGLLGQSLAATELLGAADADNIKALNERFESLGNPPGDAI